MHNDLHFRQPPAPVPGFHLQAASALAFVLVGLAVTLLISVMAHPSRGDTALRLVPVVMLPFGAGGALAAINATLIHQGRRPPALMRYAPLPVFLAVFWLVTRLG